SRCYGRGALFGASSHDYEAELQHDGDDHERCRTWLLASTGNQTFLRQAHRILTCPWGNRVLLLPRKRGNLIATLCDACSLHARGATEFVIRQPPNSSPATKRRAMRRAMALEKNRFTHLLHFCNIAEIFPSYRSGQRFGVSFRK